LRNHPGCRNHSKATVVELLGLHDFELFGVFRLEVQWVKAEISTLTVCFHCPHACAKLSILQVCGRPGFPE
jgi:hypothetical protein